jgi:maleylpyruvate isomerase
MQLYTYFRSSAAYRVRIALNLKGLQAEQVYVHLRKGDQKAADYLKLNPQGVVPTLVDGNAAIGQSLAIIEYLDEVHPQPALLPFDPVARARVRQLALLVACEIHPLNNLKVLNYLTGDMGLGEDKRLEWYRHWIDEGLTALEDLLASSPDTGAFCHGDSPGLVDVCLVPQIYNARRFDIDIAPWPTVARINEHCLGLDAFAAAAPDVQPDAE